jgi:hypothetical protein
MREPSASGIEPISVPNGGYRTLTAGCGSRCAIGGAGSGGTSYSWEKAHDAVGWSSGQKSSRSTRAQASSETHGIGPAGTKRILANMAT